MASAFQPWVRVTLAIALVVSTGSAPRGQRRAAAPHPEVMSFHNRVVLNRLTVSGYKTLDVMLMLRANGFEQAEALVALIGGRVQRSEAEVGYIRAEVPIDRLMELVSNAAVEAYQIASLARTSWYAGPQSQSRAEVERNAEVVPVVKDAAVARPELIALSPADASSSGYTADEDTGIGLWQTAHPTFDGRGVTIAFLETGLVEFGHPALQTAKAIDGAEVPKIVGILNTLDVDDADDTRVELSIRIQAARTWHRVGNRTYILPKPGAYSFGVFSLPVSREVQQSFGVLRDIQTGDVRVDTDSDADFRDERPLVDANTRMDVRHLRISHPRQTDLAFVFTEGRRADLVHLYTARSGHHTMNVSVATGSATADGLASGVAPAARALVVRYANVALDFHAIIEGYLDTAKRPDVDILCDSTGMATVPDAASEFASVFFRRLVARYGKPIFHSAGNARRYLNSVSAIGDVFSVGGSLGPATFASFYGGGTLARTIVHPWSAAGPAIDGAIKPDFLAPENRISAGVWVDNGYVPLPANAATRYLPAGYEISCCTSASSPYAAGVAALLLSAAKQMGVAYSVESLGRALRFGARFLPEWPAYQQGHGVLDVNQAWRELQRTGEVPRIVASSTVAHALTPYSRHGARGTGIFEQFGWRPGDRGRRALQVRRESGGARSVTYRVSWTRNDGTFSAPRTLTLALNVMSVLEVAIDVRAPGAHSAMLNLHDPDTDAVVFGTQVTIVAAEPVDATTKTAHLRGSIPLMGARQHFLQVPDEVSALSIELEVHEGALGAAVLSPEGLAHGYFDHVRPVTGRTFTRGRYRFLWPHPAAGIWSFNLGNTSASQERDQSMVSADDATYTITVQLLGASLSLRQTAAASIEADITNRLAALREPVLEISKGRVRSHSATTLSTGLPNLFAIEVPAAASALRVNLRSTSSTTPGLELHLYDCTSGECFLWDFTLPAARAHTTVVRSPAAGRWIAAVNSAPSPTMAVQFSLEEIVTTSVTRLTSASHGPTTTGARWTEHLEIGSMGDPTAEHQDAIVCELFDAAASRDALGQPWENRKSLFSLADRPVAVASVVWRNHQ